MKLLLCGNYGAGNVGDEAILDALLKKWGEAHDLTVISATPAATQKWSGVPCVQRLPTGMRSWLKALFTAKGKSQLATTKLAFEKADVLVLGGGTLLTDEPPASLRVWGSHLDHALNLGKRLWIEASGVGPLHCARAKKRVARWLKRAEKISVRDPNALAQVEELGITGATLVADPVLDAHWDLPPAPVDTRGAILIVPRWWKVQPEKTRKVLTAFVKWLTHEEGRKVIGIPFEANNPHEVAYLESMIDRVEKTPRTPQEIMAMIKDADLVVGMRLHSLIFAEKVGTPFVGISYMDKVQGFGASLNKSSRVLALKELTLERLQQAYSEASKDSR